MKTWEKKTPEIINTVLGTMVYPVWGSPLGKFHNSHVLNTHFSCYVIYKSLDVEWTPCLDRSTLEMLPHMLRREILSPEVAMGYMDPLILMAGSELGFLTPVHYPDSSDSKHHMDVEVGVHKMVFS